MTPVFRLHPAMLDALGTYPNGCRTIVTIPTGQPLASAVEQKLRAVFQSLDPPTAGPTDGVIDVALVTQRVTVEAAPAGSGAMPATVTLGLDLAYVTAEGTRLYAKTIERSGHGTVQRSEGGCDLIGLEAIVKQAADRAAEAVVQPMAESSQVREFAAAKPERPVLPAKQPSGEALAQGARGQATEARRSSEGASGPAAPPVPPSKSSAPPTQVGSTPGVVAFRAIVRDESRDQILQPDEVMTLEIEIKNEGTADLHGVEVLVGGTGILTGSLPPAIAIGTVKPGEIKRTVVSKPVAGATEPVRGELLLSVRAAEPLAPAPPVKQFTMWVKPASSTAAGAPSEAEYSSKLSPAGKQPKAVVLAIGVGRFRDDQVAPVKYAGRDAEAMASALQAGAGVPADRVRVIRDGQALKQDLLEAVEEWLPGHVDAASVAYIFISGRAVVGGGTGGVALVPFDGLPSSGGRLYPLRRLQEVLARLPLKRAVVMLDLSLEPMPGADPAAGGEALWNGGGTDSQSRVMWMVGNKALQDAHAYEPAKHGLFTYALLKGLHGLADLDRDGTVVAGELCTYARGEAARVAQDHLGNGQEPLCVPAAGQGALVRRHPMAKGDNPRPVAVEKKNGAASAETAPAFPQGVGP